MSADPPTPASEPQPQRGRRYPGAILRTASDYGWRLLIVGAVLYFLVKFLSRLSTVVIPFIVALLVVALLRPVMVFLRHRGLGRGIATVACIVSAVIVLGGGLTLVITQAVNQAPQLGDQINKLIPHVEHWLENGPLHVNKTQVDNFSSTLSKEVSKNSSAIASTAVSTGKTVLDVLTGLILTIFVTIFLLYDGEGVWNFVVRAVPEPGRERANRAGHAAWGTLSHYVRGTLVVAAFHGIVIAITLAILGIPLIAPLALLVAVGSFVPLVGAFVAGGLAAAVAGIEGGGVDAIIVVAVLVLDNQIEAHVLQPFVVGRYVHIHPLATVLALASGALLFGIFGAIIAVPAVACVNSAVRALLIPTAAEDQREGGDLIPPPDG